MQWMTPKTNWVSDDYINAEDFNRIRNNLMYLFEESRKYYIYKLYEIIPPEVDYSTYAFVDTWNQLEIILEKIASNTYQLEIGATKNFLPYDFYIDYKELNRLESATLIYYKMFMGQKETAPTLSFTLGDREGIKV